MPTTMPTTHNARKASLPLTLAMGAGIALAASLPARADELPKPLQALKQQGLTFHGQFDAPSGLTGYAASARGQTVAAYLTQDGQHAVVGTLINAQGNNVAAETLQRLVNGPKNAKLWDKMADQHWVRDGSADAERVVYTFSDPNCPYCHKFWEDAQPWVESGQVQIRHLMVGVLKPSSGPKAAALLSADNPSEAIAEHYRTDTMPDIKGSEESERHVSENTQLMANNQLHATPVTFYRDNEGVHRVMGAPSPEKLREIMGGEAP
ncbi:thiol:disulfide interchange protein DsbG [Halomonas almeriensis]|uniref:thiol:disulfide interchange protein DsbG n=1 Tax=Halomonas almeriensis TaxID=308163 RepID=UPI0025B503D4|nr:thiol:disulfide interchange protein DsbG [Halomonas almeriensis]MDN3552606.1 thiol:disulfide interchange protein DsbG [Halomonas almeriensis]